VGEGGRGGKKRRKHGFFTTLLFSISYAGERYDRQKMPKEIPQQKKPLASSLLPSKKSSAIKIVDPEAGGKKKKKRPSFDNYTTYITRMFREKYPKLGLKSQSTAVVDGLLRKIFTNLAVQSGDLCAHAKRATLTSKHVLLAAKLALPESMSKDAIAHATLALKRFVAYEGKNAEEEEEDAV